MLSKAMQLVKYQFSKQIRLSFVSFTQNIQNSEAKWCQKQQITPGKLRVSSKGDSFKRRIWTDTNMILMVEKGIRGGLKQVVKKHAVVTQVPTKLWEFKKEYILTILRCE